MRCQVLASFLLFFGAVVIAQRPTLREAVAESRTDVSVTVNVDGPLLLFARVLDATDLVVRGVIGQAVSHLSQDGTDIYTTYELINPQVYFDAHVAPSAHPGIVPPPITITQLGGSVRIDGYTATVHYDNSATLRSGMDVVLLLHNDNGTHRGAAAGRAMFEVRNSKIVPLLPGPGEHQRFAGMTADGFIAEVLALRQAK